MPSFLVSGTYGDDDHETSVEVYLDYDGEEEISQEQVEAIWYEYLSTGDLPDAWSVEGVNWAHGEEPEDQDDDRTWKHGDENDLDRFTAWFRNADLHIEPKGELDEDEDLLPGEEEEEEEEEGET